MLFMQFSLCFLRSSCLMWLRSQQRVKTRDFFFIYNIGRVGLRVVLCMLLKPQTSCQHQKITLHADEHVLIQLWAGCKFWVLEKRSQELFVQVTRAPALSQTSCQTMSSPSKSQESANACPRLTLALVIHPYPIALNPNRWPQRAEQVPRGPVTFPLCPGILPIGCMRKSWGFHPLDAASSAYFLHMHKENKFTINIYLCP